MHALIFLAGNLEKGNYINSVLEYKYDLIIAVDGGFSHCLDLGIKPNFLIGDFDSISQESFLLAQRMGVSIQQFPSKKDLTDSELAFELAIKEGASFIFLLGALGGKRSDHFLANIFLFNQFFKKVPFQIIDGYQRILLLEGGNCIFLDGEEKDYISILPFGGDIEGLTGDGLLYPLNNISIKRGFSLGLSNELTQTSISICLEKGRSLVIQSKRAII